MQKYTSVAVGMENVRYSLGLIGIQTRVSVYCKREADLFTLLSTVTSGRHR